jgi:DNA polymerase-1
MKRLIIIDVSNFIFRAYFAIRPLHAPNGTPVNAVYGVLSMLHNMILKHKPTHVLIAKDNKEGSFREEIYPEYKANRSEPPDELIPQFPLVEELIHVLGIPEIRMPRYEADDIIGSIATQWKNDFDEILIASGDKDLMQFVDGPIKMLDTMKDKIYEREDVKDKMGVYPEQIVDYLALIGDSSDNIPGVPGIGPKGAQGLLEEFKTLEKILENVEIIKNKRCQTALIEHKDKAIISKELAKIVTDLSLKFNATDVSYHIKVTPEVEEFLERLGFRSWLSKLSDFKMATPSKPKIEVPKVVEKLKIEKWSTADLKKHIANKTSLGLAHLSLDEMNQLRRWTALAVATTEGIGIVNLEQEEVLQVFKAIEESGSLIICFQSKPLLQQFLLSGIYPTFKYFDLAQAHFLINPEFRHDLATLTEEFLGETLEEFKGQTDLFGNIAEDGWSALGEKARMILSLHPILREKMKEIEVERPYDELDIPLIKVLAEIELEGVNLDVDFFKELEIEFTKQLDQIESEVVALAGGKINLRSPKQVGELLFEKLNLPVIKKTKTGYSTDADVLSELSALKISPVPEMLLKYRELEKLLSTYVRTLPLIINSQSGKIHTHFQPSNAATGRLSSDNPNLQNIPVRSENGRKLRKGFIASKGCVLLSADYSQVELRLLAHFSQDKYMLDAFHHDLDIHQQTAAEIFEVPLKEVTREMRNSAKAINFGLMYGQTSFGLSQALKISQGDAKKYITAYFKKFHSVKSYLDGLKELAEDTGYAITMFGRKRILPDIKSSNRQVKALAERVAINSPIQGTAADIIKLAMINIQNHIHENKLTSKMILQVHDELIFDVPSDEIELMKKLVLEKMEGAVSLSIPLKVNLGMGHNWYDLK